MITKRIIASLIIKDDTIVQSIGFARYLPVGSPEVAVEFLNAWGADEIVVLDISARERGGPNVALVRRLADKSFVPLSYGGGIDTVAQMRELIQEGADKVVINTAAQRNPALITEAAAVFGNQCVVVSIDVHEGAVDEAVDRAKLAAGYGAGEILLRTIERDGSKRGYDLELVRAVAGAVDLPVIAAGGCGVPQHAAEVLGVGADAAAVGNMLHFTEHSVATLKAQIKDRVLVRQDTHATYEQASFDAEGRQRKQDDATLERLRFEYHPKETI